MLTVVTVDRCGTPESTAFIKMEYCSFNGTEVRFAISLSSPGIQRKRRKIKRRNFVFEEKLIDKI